MLEGSGWVGGVKVKEGCRELTGAQASCLRFERFHARITVLIQGKELPGMMSANGDGLLVWFHDAVWEANNGVICEV